MNNAPENPLRIIERQVCSEIQNIGNAVEEEIGYVKSILTAIELMAETDSHRYKLEIVSLAKSAHWMADNLEANVDHFGEHAIIFARQLEKLNIAKVGGAS